MAIEQRAMEPPLTVADYHDYADLLLPEEPTPELMNGGIIVAARPNYDHMYFAQEIFAELREYLRQHHLAGRILTEFEVVLDRFTVVVPDIAYIAPDSPLSRFTPERMFGAPEFVCEIASPRTRKYDAHEKYLAYLRSGVREYWLVDPALPAGERFTMFERIETEAEVAAMRVNFQRIAGHDPAASHLFPSITFGVELL